MIALIGPESCGKSTLARQLASYFGGLVVDEYARQYLEERNGRYTREDLLTIAQGQRDLERQAMATGTAPIFCDTNTVVIEVWSEVKYGSVDARITSLHDPQRYKLTLLLRPDLPWEADPLRENPNDRQELFERYEQTLARWGNSFQIIEGLGDARLHLAIEAVARVIGS